MAPLSETLRSTHVVVTTKWKSGEETVTMLVNFKGYVLIISHEDINEVKQFYDFDFDLFIIVILFLLTPFFITIVLLLKLLDWWFS